MPSKEDEAVKKVDVFKKILKVLKGVKKAGDLPVEEIEPKRSIKKKFKEGADPYAGYFCDELFQKKKKSGLELEGQRVLDAIVHEGVEDEEEEDEEDEESTRVD